MDKEIFIPPATEKIKNSISDFAIIRETVNAYYHLNFKAMQGFILEYGEADFFSDLNKYFNAGYWKNPANKYATFVGMTLAFFKMWE